MAEPNNPTIGSKSMDDSFKVLQKKEIYEFLEGSGDQQLVQHKGSWFGLPYHSAVELDDICRSFGYTGELGGSRWTYVEALMQFAIEQDRCSELLSYLLSVEQFTNLNGLFSMDEIDDVHQEIIIVALEKLNLMIRLTRKELVLYNGKFYIVEAGRQPVIQTPAVNAITVPYVHSLRERCEADLLSGNFDSVITKSRTLMEETLIHYLEQRGETVTAKGDLIKLYGQVKSLRGMTQSSQYDSRVNDLLSGLEKLVNSIASMRNMNSDAHGAGSGRINIKEKEARLVMNAAITYCEYMLS